MFLKVKSHIGIAGNEAADKLAGEAADSSKFDQVISVGNESPGLQDSFWPHSSSQCPTCLICQGLLERSCFPHKQLIVVHRVLG